MLGERIRGERIRCKLTQENLAERIHLTRTSITNIEKGRQKLLVHTLVDLADVFGIAPSQLLSPFDGDSVAVEPTLPADLAEPVRSWIMSGVASARKRPRA